MQIKQFGKTYIVRIDKGEEIVETLKSFCESQNVKLGTISGIGAVERVVIGLFDTKAKQYYSNKYVGDYEICSLIGSVSTMNGKPYLHTHIVIADIDNKTYGGHLNQAIVSATCEVFVNAVEGEIDREFSEEIGLNLIK